MASNEPKKEEEKKEGKKEVPSFFAPKKEESSTEAKPFNFNFNFDFTSQAPSNSNTAFSFSAPGTNAGKFGSKASALAQDPELLSFVSGQLNQMVGKTSGYLESLPKSVQNRVKKLKEINEEVDAIDKNFEREMNELAMKYHLLRKPLWQKRAAIVQGESDADTATKEDSSDIKGIPEFWLTALKNHPLFEEAITPEDEEALKYLKDITFDPIGEEYGSFRVDFHFADNPFFTNTVLSKTYHVVLEQDEPICESIDSATIDWKEGKDILKGKTGKLGDPMGSFFWYFSPPDLNEKAKDEDILLVERDFAMAAVLRDKIIPNAVNWFTGEAQLTLSDSEDDDENILNFKGSKYDSDEDEDYEPDEDEEKEKDVPPGECKQQ